MKKIFTLIAAASVGVAFASAAPHFDTSRYHVEGVNPKYASIAANPASVFEGQYFEQSVKEGRVMHRVMEQGNFIYNVTFNNIGPLTDFWQITMDRDGVKRNMEFKDWPFYAVSMNLTRANKNDPENPNTRIICYLSWPSEAFMNSDNILMDLYGDKDNEPAGFDGDLTGIIDMAELAQGRAYSNMFVYQARLDKTGGLSVDNLLPGLFYTDDSKTEVEVGFWPIWSPMVGATANSTVNGKECALASDNPDNYNDNTNTKFAITSFESGSKVLKMEYNFRFTEGVVPMESSYDGDCTVINMVLQDLNWTPKTVHVYNGGITTQGGHNDEANGGPMYPYTFGYPDGNNTFSPVQEFYMWAMVGNLIPGIKSVEEVVPYDPTILTVAKMDENYEPQPSDWNWVEGAFWTSGDQFMNNTINLKPGKRYMAKYPGSDMEVEVICASPEPNIALDYGYSTPYFWSSTRGLTGALDGFSIFFSTPTQFAFGTKDGFSLVGVDRAGNTYKISGIEEVMYHSDPENMRVAETVNVKGNHEMNGVDFVVEDNGANVVAADGTISVIAANAVDVAVFNLNGSVVAKADVAAGETASFQVEKGVYLVKVGRNAKKVIL